MKKKRLFGRCLMPLDLQHFAEPGDGTGEGTGDGGGDGTGEGKGDGVGAKTPSFDDFLKEEENQTEFTRRLKEAVAGAISENNEKWKIITDEKLSEAEKLAKMTKEEAAEYKRKKQEKDLADRAAAITKRELMAEANITLANKGLPVVLAEVLSYTDADSCNASIAVIEKTFKEALEKAVEERIRGGKPPKKPDGEIEENSVSDFVDIIKENQSKR